MKGKRERKEKEKKKKEKEKKEREEIKDRLEEFIKMQKNFLVVLEH